MSALVEKLASFTMGNYKRRLSPLILSIKSFDNRNIHTRDQVFKELSNNQSFFKPWSTNKVKNQVLKWTYFIIFYWSLYQALILCGDKQTSQGGISLDFSYYLASPSKGEPSITIISIIFISISWLIPKQGFDLRQVPIPNLFLFLSMCRK